VTTEKNPSSPLHTNIDKAPTCILKVTYQRKGSSVTLWQEKRSNTVCCGTSISSLPQKLSTL